MADEEGNGGAAEQPGGKPAGGAPSLAAAPEFARDWGLVPEVGDWMTRSGFKTPADFASGFMATKKLVGHDPKDVIVRPKEGDATARLAVMRALGAPEKAADYGLKPPEGVDGKFLEVATGWFAELGIPKAEAAGLVERWNAYGAAQQKASDEQFAAERKAGLDALKAKHGDGMGRLAAEATAATRQAGLTDEQVRAIEDVLGVGPATEFMAKLGKPFVESAFKGADSKGGTFDLTLDQIDAEIDALRADKAFVARWNAGDVEARKKIAALNELKASKMPTMATANATPMSAGASAPMGGRLAAM